MPCILTRAIAAVLGVALLLAAGSGADAETTSAVVRSWEEKLDARIGVMLRPVDSEWTFAYRADERFPLSSTFKTLLCAAVLARVDAGKEHLWRLLHYRKDDLVTYSPVTEAHTDTGLSVAALCEATITVSDNTAANLLLRSIGGPEGLTGFLRGIGDTTTRLDRWETALNEAAPGDVRDTTTPGAVLGSLQELLFGDTLSTASRSQLQAWMIADQVADALLRRHLPENWIIGDKTGAGGQGSRSITAFLITPAGETYLAAIYLTGSRADLQARDEALADIGRSLIEHIQSR